MASLEVLTKRAISVVSDARTSFSLYLLISVTLAIAVLLGGVKC
jgi:hypothetical protein